MDEDLAMLFETLGKLRALASADETTPSDAAIYDFSIRWGTLLAGRLLRLARLRDDDRLGPADRDRFDELRAELQDALPLIDRLGLARPAVAWQDTGSTAAAQRRGPEV